jgi:glycine/D-amino acid oxidase-like deaminating enzyme
LKLIPGEAGDWTAITNAANHPAARVMVAAGAWSATLPNPLGLHLPLDTERGYRPMFSGSPVQLTHTVPHKDWGVVPSPFEEALCASCEVGLAGLIAAPDERRTGAVARRPGQLFPGAESVEPTIWMGFVPSIADSLSCDRRRARILWSLSVLRTRPQRIDRWAAGRLLHEISA